MESFTLKGVTEPPAEQHSFTIVMSISLDFILQTLENALGANLLAQDTNANHYATGLTLLY